VEPADLKVTSECAWNMNSSGVFGEAECRCRVTAGSQSPGIGRVLQVTKGHQPGRFRIREDDTGVCRTPEDTSPPRFGTVRPRVQIPGPRPISELKSIRPAELM
jgi:hypothetical protein